ncbi:preprotein translocase, YajC subunit [Isosphaera pallida ATCC 43644]|jgi:preprotein translocase subunit YajC|uniref:Sec translocon accessory complex subunit YajC n=1 Tax=Isosphaera pallida (strain ATCC 43644 / DSM 9630 / IS1B) TaxID=575540 RepID=E8R0B3_ISOPI|nr:preprotein translocase subunit YajC [Isosphaera pallida]ADV62240.1 preprotein translocase, YajC subunit [Isosphaera pallida ATCC 43644]
MFGLGFGLILVAQQQPAATSSLLTFMIPWLLVMVLFYALIIAPQRRQEKERLAQLAALKKNDKVLTVGGIYGTVVSAPAGEDKIVLKLDDEGKIKVSFSRASIAKVLQSANSPVAKPHTEASPAESKPQSVSPSS